ncbi:alpha-glucuronidase family glycosyl hydrolase [Alicyclobacillus ferrooxydans]|uniref:Xylan alpha-1,2-glucuronidase n=1 Tax=Alicyclobacillus ferrooxydans TaxID=471514 RepID=A0A0P9GLA0_9BACL|nr:alpha-glucuronidase family glycosyl hydrolase [Alicyclobacillus ferrooxydans]KPV40918.1 alpha-glucuronidase [Alicyclobacillus ferrooxydans]
MKGFSRVVCDECSELLETAKKELLNGLARTTGYEFALTTELREDDAVVLGTLSSLQIQCVLSGLSADHLGEEGYAIYRVVKEGRQRIVLTANTAKGCLYAVFHFLRLLQTGEGVASISLMEAPKNKLRMINHWDNMDGSIERGYAGRSIFYRDNKFFADLTRVKDYARLLASVGINAVTLNNVNVHEVETYLITDQFLPDVARVAAVFRKYGIQTFLSVNFASPIEAGGLPTADPDDPVVKQWWETSVERIYRFIPDFGGFLVKADSEFRPGPFTYGRDHADGANMLAEALIPHGGIVIWRCFVYNCTQDWRDRSTDRARAAFDHFTPFDGRCHDNVILQIKNGPMDFQVREPVSPLFGGLMQTNQVLELQITQEYTGQQRHLCYLVPQWKQVLDFDLHSTEQGCTVAKVVSGELHHRPLGGVAAVANIGDDMNWTGHLLAQANLYGYGRLAWNPELSAQSITDEWVALTFGRNYDVLRIVSNMLLGSWQIYENYTAPLGVGWMVNPGDHYGPNVDGYEYSKWGTYHFADCKGIGVDRTVQTGTGYTGQYHSPHSELFESLETCPEELLLFFHHVPYTHRLRSGETVIQYIYDTHFRGVEQAMSLIDKWKELENKLDDSQFEHVLERLHEQASHAKQWRDVINTYFYRKSGIADERGRVIFS